MYFMKSVLLSGWTATWVQVVGIVPSAGHPFRVSWKRTECHGNVPSVMETYRVDRREQLQRRIDEFTLSGFCTKCMIWVMERDRNQPLGVQDKEGL
jgi:hypothetical protein